MKHIEIFYFAYLREQAGCSSERITTEAKSLCELYLECSERHGFTLPVEVIRVAVNQSYISMDSDFADQASIAFLPPVSGG